MVHVFAHNRPVLLLDMTLVVLHGWFPLSRLAAGEPVEGVRASPLLCSWRRGGGKDCILSHFPNRLPPERLAIHARRIQAKLWAPTLDWGGALRARAGKPTGSLQ